MFSTNKKMNLSAFKKIYLMVPANVSTGGPEALHQLGFVLKNMLNKDIKIFYVPTDSSNPVHDNYKKYSLNFTNHIEDDSDNLIIVPEYFNFLVKTLQFKKIKKLIWWLSIDNYIGSRFRNKNTKFFRSTYKIPFNIIDFFNKFSKYFFGILTIEEYLKFFYRFKDLNNHKEINQANFHVVQSNYAKNFLEDKLKFVESLSDYIRDDFLNDKTKRLDNKQRKNIICYNPQKSNDFMNLIIKKTNYDFVPLINLNNEQIIDTLSKSKIYIDFGSHPGKDRLPREAALLGNCIITNLKGSAANFQDISIPLEFKFKENYKNLNNINDKIEMIFNNYDKEFYKFNSYLNKIFNEKETFIREVKDIFK